MVFGQSSTTYTIPIPVAGPPEKVELYVDKVGDWEVTISFDSARCELYCAYRRIPDAFGRTGLINALLPPIAVVRIYTDPIAKPATVIVDPAGLRLRTVTGAATPTYEEACLPARRLFALVLVGNISNKILGSVRANPHSPYYHR